MMKLLKRISILIVSILFAKIGFSQNVVSGYVKNKTSGEPIPAVSIMIKGNHTGTLTNEKGYFKLATGSASPVILIVSSIGYETQEVNAAAGSNNIEINMVPSFAIGNEVVVSASRTRERIMESPVSIEHISSAQIKNSAQSDYYNILKNVAGVNFTQSSLTFNSVSTRGGAGSGNTDLGQYLDGMDNRAPGLNFPVGSFLGPPQLDIENVELLPGASSALYGSGGLNGTVVITTKDPFIYEGLSAEVKQGIMHLGNSDPVGASPYYDLSFRWAKKVSDKFAFKISGQYIQAKDWMGTDTSNYDLEHGGKIPGTRATDPNYVGVNVYGNEISAGITNADPNYSLFAGVLASQFGPDPSQWPVEVQQLYATDGSKAFNVSRTGYNERDLMDNNTMNLRLNGAMYYKINDRVTASLMADWSTGKTVYTGSNRYAFTDASMGQYKLELKSKNWFVRAYTTQENAGKAYDMGVTSIYMNEAFNPSISYDESGNISGGWYPDYTGAYVGARLQGASEMDANNAARAYADRNRPLPGTQAYKDLFNQVTNTPFPNGSKFIDHTSLYHTEAQYNFSDVIKFADVIAGASFRTYTLNSEGTLFADADGPITTNEYGAYVSASKKLISDKLKLGASLRYDKNENFDGKFTPRITAVFEVAKQQFIRASYQNAYSNPDNRSQWEMLNLGSSMELGGLTYLHNKNPFELDKYPLYTASSYEKYQQSGDENDLVLQQFEKFVPPSINSYEIGYRGIFGNHFLVDAYGYIAKNKDVIASYSAVRIKPDVPDSFFSIWFSSPDANTTYGYGLSLTYSLNHNWSVSFNTSRDMGKNPSDSNKTVNLSIPGYRFNAGINNYGFGYQKRFGMNVNWRWQDAMYSTASFRSGMLPASNVIDAQVSYKFIKANSKIKLGATNLLNHYTIDQFGNPAIGGLYYVAFSYGL
jgi:outer membrane receptor protein involved in Fe transport